MKLVQCIGALAQKTLKFVNAITFVISQISVLIFHNLWHCHILQSHHRVHSVTYIHQS